MMQGRMLKCIVRCELIVLMLLLPVVIGAKAVSASSFVNPFKTDTLSDSDSGIKVRYTFGNSGYVKVNRNVLFNAEVENRGEDFSGVIRILMETEYGSQYEGMVEQPIDVAAGASKNVEMVLIERSGTMSYKVQLCDEDGEVLAEKEAALDEMMESSDMSVGVLSGNSYKLGYLQSAFNRNASIGYAAEGEDDDDTDVDDVDYMDNDTFEAAQEAEQKYASSGNWNGTVVELQAEDIGDDVEKLDVFDLLILDDFDTTVLREEQKKAIVRWVSRGGVLLLSTGGNPQKVLKGFEEEFPVKISGQAKTVNTTLGWSREDIIQLSGSKGNTEAMQMVISNLKLADATKTLLKEDGEKLMQLREFGRGSVIVSEFSMQLPTELWSTYGRALLAVIVQNLGKRYYNDIAWTSWYSGGSYQYEIRQALARNEVDVLPNLMLYAALLLIYAVVVGPVLYLVFKKKDKSIFLWVAVPITAVVFSVTIYLLGTSTRIKNPYVKYLAEIDLDTAFSGEAVEDTFYMAASPSGKKYQLQLSDTLLSVPAYSEDYSVGTGGMENGYGVRQENDGTVLKMNKVTAFSDEEFYGHRRLNMNGDIDINIKRGKGGAVSGGTVTNRLDYTLEDCFIKVDDWIYYWEEIPAGKSVSIDDAKNSPMTNISAYDFTSYLGQELGIEELEYGMDMDNLSDCRVPRKAAMLQRMAMRGLAINWFYGYLKEGDDAELFPSLFDDSVDHYGVTAVTKNIN